MPPFFRALRELGAIADDEMVRVFNMGIGMVVVVDPSALDELVGDPRSNVAMPRW